MTVSPHPQRHDVIEKKEMAPAWDQWFTNLKDEVNRGEPPVAIQNIDPTVGVRITSPRTNITIRVQSAGSGDANITAVPQMTAGFDGQLVKIIGEDDVKTVTLHDGDGFKLSAGITLKEHTNLVVEFNGNKALWIEQSRALT